ncbi:MAG: hypothetical protein ICV68_06500 [Pyrinomonadaceae bacterium]|nr:hypothetical protein [Pyrinomonadaceae bacterium]
MISLNKAPLWVTIILGAVGLTLLALGIIPEKYSTTVILALLGLLAFDALVERVGYLEKMEASLADLKKEVAEGNKTLRATIDAEKARFANREALNARESFETFLRRGSDILISGLTLAGTVGPNLKFFEGRVREGATLRFLMLNGQDEKLLELAALAHGVSVKALRSGIESSLAALDELKRKVGAEKADSIEIRLLKTLPTASITTVGLPRGQSFMSGLMRCELYIYQTGVNERPAFQLTPADDIIFSQYKTAVEELWDTSEPYVAHADVLQLASKSADGSLPVAAGALAERQPTAVERRSEMDVEHQID